MMLLVDRLIDAGIHSTHAKGDRMKTNLAIGLVWYYWPWWSRGSLAPPHL